MARSIQAKAGIQSRLARQQVQASQAAQQAEAKLAREAQEYTTAEFKDDVTQTTVSFVYPSSPQYGGAAYWGELYVRKPKEYAQRIKSFEAVAGIPTEPLTKGTYTYGTTTPFTRAKYEAAYAAAPSRIKQYIQTPSKYYQQAITSAETRLKRTVQGTDLH